MKKTFITMIWSSIIALVLYIILSNILLGVLRGVENQVAKLTIISFITIVLFVIIFFYFFKVTEEACLKEVMKDYKNKAYVSMSDDFKNIIKSEKATFICIAVIVIGCFALNELDALMFEKKTFSIVTFLFYPLCTFSSVFEMVHWFSIFGYLSSLILICLIYICMLLFYRRKKYKQWKK